MPHKKFRIGDRGSRAVQVLETAWADLRKIEPALPSAIITVVARTKRRSTGGHFHGSQWRHSSPSKRVHEVALTPDLFSDPTNLAEVLVHEAAHALLFDSLHTGGCTLGTPYHRKEFRDKAVELGLICEFDDTRRGWTLTSWPPTGAPSRYDALIKTLRKLPAGTEGPELFIPKGRALPKSGRIRLECKCPVPRSIYAARSVVLQGNIYCRICASSFSGYKK